MITSVVSGLAAQPPIPTGALPAGFAASVRFATTGPVAPIRSVLRIDARRHLLAIRDALHLVGDRLGANAIPSLTFSGDDIAFLARTGQGPIFVGTLSGKLWRLDAVTLAPTGLLAGVANSFDAVALPSGELLVAANPTWPAGGAHSSIWHVTANQPPRDILPLIGPSAPLLVLSNGDLVVAELGAIVPPPPGTARLLRIPAARLQAALSGAMLSMVDVVEIGGGYDGVYDLIEDDVGRLLSTDPQNGKIAASLPGSLATAGIWIDLGAGRFAAGLQFVPHATGAFRGFQPRAHAPELLAATTDYSSWYELLGIAPRRPLLTASPGPILPVGSSSITVVQAPANGLVVWLASLTTNTAEHIAVTISGLPVWLGMPAIDTVVLGFDLLDPQGSGSWPLVNPGGSSVRIDCQAVVFAPNGDLGSSNLLALLLQP